jgi:hypothetical protein
MATIFPADPQVNDEYQGYRYNGTSWDIIGIDLTADYLTTSDASAIYQAKSDPVSITQSSNNANYPLTISSANEQGGGAGFSDILKMVNSKSGAININKHLRMTSDGTLEIINSAYTAGIFSISDAGLITASNLGDTGWITISSFSNSYNGYNSIAYRKLNNVVYLRGAIKDGTANATAFTLPSGYRPSQGVVFACQKFGTTGVDYVSINSDGTVVPNSANAWLSGVVFPLG